MNCKRKGTRNEHRAIRLLREAGYSCTRSGASLGAWDIVAIGPNDVRLVQCKSNRWPSKEEIHKMELFPAPAGCIKLVFRFDDRKKEPLIRVVGKEA